MENQNKIIFVYDFWPQLRLFNEEFWVLGGITLPAAKRLLSCS